MARAHRHRGLRIVFVTAVAAGLAGMILVIVISFQPGPAAQAYAPSGSNHWKALTGLGVTVGLLGTITGLITGVVRRRVDGDDAASVGFPGQRVVIDVVPADPGIFNPTPGQGISFLSADLLLGLIGGPLVLMLAVGWLVLEIQCSGDAERAR
jgi:hypothetical protein